jgi:tetraacyldisaccharide 4'-kinase
LDDVDIIVCNGVPSRGEFRMSLVGGEAHRLGDGSEVRPLGAFVGRPVHAVAGIGNPARFFGDLRKHGLEVIEHPFPDHHRFVAEELEFGDGLPVLMTEKDAVKCEAFALDDAWCCPVTAEVAPQLEIRLQHALGGIETDGQETA